MCQPACVCAYVCVCVGLCVCVCVYNPYLPVYVLLPVPVVSTPFDAYVHGGAMVVLQDTRNITEHICTHMQYKGSTLAQNRASAKKRCGGPKRACIPCTPVCTTRCHASALVSAVCLVALLLIVYPCTPVTCCHACVSVVDSASLASGMLYSKPSSCPFV